MKSVNIKGKDYVMVNERLKYFREKYEGWSLTSEIINLTDDSCVIKAIISDPDGMIRATGLAQEDKTSSIINKTSFVENCETSAWGRALGNLGIGIDDSVASAEEVDMAIKKQEMGVEVKKQSQYRSGLHCEDCDEDITDKVANYSKDNYGKMLCFKCQKNYKAKDIEI